MKKMSRMGLYKMNSINLAKHHKKFCNGKDCNVNLVLFRMMTEELGVKFSDKEKELFL